jgi:hypothetical protein
MAAGTLLDAIAPQLDVIVEASIDAVFSIPGYRDRPQLRTDVALHVRAHLEAVLETHAEARTPVRADVALIREFATRRVGRISIAEFVHAFEVGQQPLWEWVLSYADDESRKAEMVQLLLRIRQYFTLATVEAAEVYMEAEHARGATAEAVRRDLLHELLAGHPPTPGPRLDAARAAGLEAGTVCIVISAVLTAPNGDEEEALRTAATVLARIASTAIRPLIVVRVGEIVVVMRAPGDAGKLAARLEQARAELARQGVPLAIAASTGYQGLAEVADAYREAVAAREQLLPAGGAIALSAMSAFEYLTWRTDVTARHLIDPKVSDFIARDLSDGGVLIDTLTTYYEADLNAKLAADRMHLHVNTVYYRLTKIEDSTGTSIRSVRDVVELLIAARLCGPHTNHLHRTS